MSEKYSVLVMSRLHENAMSMLDACDDIDYRVTEDLTEQALKKEIVDVDAITVRTAKISADLISAAPRLKVIARHGVGYDNVDMEAATARGIPVTITAEANSDSVAEHTLYFMLSLARCGPRYDRESRKGNWMAVRSTVDAVDLGGRNLLIMGVGRIGRRVAPLANAFGMRVMGYDPALDAAELKARGVEPVTDWRKALAEADFVTLHCPRNDDTVGLIGADELQSMKTDASIINCARGGIIDEAALYSVLKSGHLRGAGLDVFDQEPVPTDSPLLSLENVLITPHSAAATEQGMDKMGRATVQSVIDYFGGHLDPAITVNPETVS